MKRLIADIIRCAKVISWYYLARTITSNIRLALGYDPVEEAHFSPIAILGSLLFSIIIIPLIIWILETYVPRFRRKKVDEGWSPW